MKRTPRKTTQVKVSDRAYVAIKEEIISGELPPGSTISELELAQRYKISRTPIREACQFLQKDGFLESVPHKGFFVSEITVEQIQNIYQLRFVLERTSARIAAERILPADVEELMFLARPIAFTASDPVSFRASIEQNKKFHLKIADVTGNQELVAILSNILDKIHRTQYLEAKAAPKMVGPEHQAIAGAIARRDPAAAEEAMNTHIQTSLDRLLSVVFNWTNGYSLKAKTS